MVPWLRRRRLSVPSLAFAGWPRRFRRARDPRTTVARSVSGGVRRRDIAREYGARTAKESVSHGLHPLELIPRWGGQRPLSDCSCHSTAASERVPSDPLDLLPNDEASRVWSFSPWPASEPERSEIIRSFDERL